MHTSLQIGGPADVYAIPRDTCDLLHIFGLCLREQIPCFVLGEGSNVLVADDGMAGVVVDLGQIDSVEVQGTSVRACAGASLETVVETAYCHGLAGLETFAAMPGSVGGAIWMNARCYGKSISDVAVSVDVVAENLSQSNVRVSKTDFGYKRSPFQATRSIIVGCELGLKAGDKQVIRARMAEVRADREQKGHFRWPSAGSAFKNDRSFGMPAGRIIDGLGLKGQQIGGAKVSDLHANMVVNTGSATANDVHELLRLIERSVRERYGRTLEREILLVGKWGSEPRQ